MILIFLVAAFVVLMIIPATSVLGAFLWAMFFFGLSGGIDGEVTLWRFAFCFGPLVVIGISHMNAREPRRRKTEPPAFIASHSVPPPNWARAGSDESPCKPLRLRAPRS